MHEVKNSILTIILIIFFTTFSLPKAWGQLYQYKDKNGNIVFTDKPPAGETVKEKQLKDDGVYWSNQREADLPPSKDSSTTQSSLPLENKRSRDYSGVTVVMYMADWCGYCKKAREYIHSLGANLVEHDIEKEPDMKTEMKKISGGSTSIPLIDIDGTIIRGYNPPAIKAALDKNVMR